jgi:hypothetical protein
MDLFKTLYCIWKQLFEFILLWFCICEKSVIVNSPPDRIVPDEWLFQKRVVRTKFVY